MRKIIRPVDSLQGEIEVPGDKSISHRALIIGAMPSGKMSIFNLASGQDCLSTMNCLKNLGIKIQKEKDRVVVNGRGLFGFQEPQNFLDAGNSGTTMRILCGVLAGQSFYSVVTGDKSLRNRPMKRVIEPLQKMGAEIYGRSNNQLAPITISGKKLNSIEYTIPVPSAQVKTALILAGLLASDRTTIHENIPTRDHTERMLKYLGIDIASQNGSLVVSGQSEIKSKDIFVPGDISSAIYFIGAGLLVENSHIKIKNVGLNPGRIGALQVLKRMGAKIEIKTLQEINCEPVGEIEIKTSNLKGTEILSEEIPSLIDEIPLLSVLACLAEGKTIIKGAQELRVKETDRLKTIASELNKLGANIKELPEGLEISGPAKLKGALVQSFGDHRMAMGLAVAGLVAEGETVIENSEAINVSFPNFFEILDSLTEK